VAKKSGKNAANLLRLSGLLYGLIGTFHVLRYFKGWDFKIGSFELTFFGSLIVGILLLFLSLACFVNSK
jgi:hypothetical protein